MDTQSLRTLGLQTTVPLNAYELLTSREDNSEIVKILRDFVAEFNASAPTEKITIKNSKDVVKVAGNIFKGLDHEQCWILFVNNGLKVIGKKKISDGITDAVLIDNRSIILDCLNKNAYGVILMHNHPSGDTNPSRADISQTESLKKALNSLDIQLIDHVIFGEKDYYSFSDGTINKYES